MRYNSPIRVAALFLPVGLLAAAGCSPTPLKVEGRVVWEDGKPVGGASVRFVPVSGTIEAIGFTDKEGNFTLASGGAGAGALPGAYKVVVAKAAGGAEYKGGEAISPEAMAKAGKEMFAGKPAIPHVVDPVPGKYASVENTPLTWTVDKEHLKPEFKITRK